jgi:AmiR/NasT family two-component response regulator
MAMALQVLKDLRGLKVQVIHPSDAEGVSLIEHLKRIGCAVEAVWPIPDGFAPGADIVMLAIEHDCREKTQRLLKTAGELAPTLIAIVGYEDPTTLQLVLESGALAVIERPIRPFGLLTNLTIARSLWLERESARKRMRKLERKVSGMQKVQRAKEILMSNHGISESVAYQTLREQAMAKRVPMEEMANAIINANELLSFRMKCD